MPVWKDALHVINPWLKRGSLQTTGCSIDEVTYTSQAPNAMFNPTHTAMPVHVVIAPSKCSQ
jgi:hypothetical protein